MKTYTLFCQILEKARAVRDAQNAVDRFASNTFRIEDPKAIIEGLQGLPSTDQPTFKSLPEWEVHITETIDRTNNRVFKLLFADYCTQRDELKALLNQEVLPVQDAVNHLTQAKRASNAALAYPQMFSSESRMIDLSTLPPENPRHVCDGQDGMNSDCTTRKRAAKS